MSDKATPHPRRGELLFSIVVGLALLLFLPTLQPGIGWYNTGEFAAAAMTLDVPHAPGYPLFTRMANLILQLPIVAEPAWKVNLLAALLGAVGAGGFALWLRWGGISPLLAGAAAIWMVSFTTFWEMATSAEVYTTEIMLLAGLLLALWRIRNMGHGLGGWLLVGVVAGLGTGHRPTFLPLFLGTVAIAMGCSRRPGELCFGQQAPAGTGMRWGSVLTGIFLGFALGMLPTFDLYLRLQNPGLVLTDPQAVQGWDGFWRMFTAAAYRKGLGVFTLPELLARGRSWSEMMVADGGIAVVILPWLAWLGRPETLNPQVFALTWVLLVNTGFILNYNAFEAHTMLLPSMLALTGLAAHGLHARRGRGRRLLGGALVLVAAVSLLVSAHRLEPRGREAEDWAKRVTAGIPKGATLLVSNDVEFRPLWYLRLARGFRPDLAFRLIDRIEEKDLVEIERDVANKGAFGTLVYPENLQEWLSTRFRLESLGYVTAVLPPGVPPQVDQKASWSVPLLSVGTGTVRAALDSVIPRGEAVRTRQGLESGSDVPNLEVHPGDVVSWRLAVAGLKGQLSNYAAGAILTDRAGGFFRRHGVVLGCSIRPLTDGMSPVCFKRALECDSFELHRTLVIPPEIPTGTYELRVFLVDRHRREGRRVFTERLSGLNLLNEDGANEVFKLKNGLGNSVPETLWLREEPLYEHSSQRVWLSAAGWGEFQTAVFGDQATRNWLSLGRIGIR